MTREEAIFILMNSNEYHHAKGDLPHSALSVEAFNMAIEALKKKRLHGEWEGHVERRNLNTRKCTSCGEYGAVGYFCMWCGADMRKEG